MIRRFALALALAAALSGATGSRFVAAEPAFAASSDAGVARLAPRQVPTIEPASDGDGFTLSADFEVPLTRSLEDAVSRGVPLYFVIEFQLYRPRWWWYDEQVVERSRTWRLAYHALTRQYRVTVNGVIHPFERLEEALESIVRVRNWRVVSDADELDPGTTYDAQVRLRLDTSQLPKPFQIRGLTNRDWNPQAEWKRFTFTLPTPKSAQ